MAQRPEDLTIDYKKLLRLSMPDRRAVMSSSLGQELANALTPSQRAALFPKYIRDNLPMYSGGGARASAALSGFSSPMATSSGDNTASPAPSDGDSSVPSTSSTNRAPSQEYQEKKKETFDKRLEREYNEKQFSKSGYKIVGGATIPKDASPETVEALNSVANRYGLKPSAIAMMIKLESGWNTKNKTGSYNGLTQIGHKTFKEAGGKLGGMTYDQFKNASPADQIKVYGDWLQHYKFSEQLQKNGIDLSKMSAAQQAAYLQGMQFAPNAQNWKKEFAKGNYNFRTTKSDQADALGSTSIADMTRYYEGLEAKNPAKLDESATQVQETSNLPNGSIMTGVLPSDDVSVKPLDSLPNGLDSGIVDYYNKLDDEGKLRFRQHITNIPVDQVNSYYREDKATVSPEAVRERTAELLREPGTLYDNVIESQQQVAGIRKGAIQETLKKSLSYAAEQSGDANYKVEVDVTSGGQRMEGASGHTGSHRHDKGGAADVNAYLVDRKTGKRTLLDPRKEEHVPYISKLTKEFSRAHKDAGVGAMYMDDKTKIHYGGENIGGRETGPIAYDGPQWFRQAHAEGVRQRMLDLKEKRDIIAEWQAKKLEDARVAASSVPVQDPATTGKLDTGVLVPEQSQQAPTITPSKQQETPQPGLTQTAQSTDARALPSPVNPPSSPVVSAAMAANKYPPTHPQFKDYRDDPAVKAEAAAAAQTQAAKTAAPTEPTATPTAPAPAPTEPTATPTAPASAEPTATPTEEVLPIEVDQSVPEMKTGGEGKAENLAIVDRDSGKVKAYANDTEKFTVMPGHRNDPNSLSNIANQNVQEQYAQVEQQAQQNNLGNMGVMQQTTASQNRANPSRVEAINQITSSSENVVKSASYGRHLRSTNGFHQASDESGRTRFSIGTTGISTV